MHLCTHESMSACRISSEVFLCKPNILHISLELALSLGKMVVHSLIYFWETIGEKRISQFLQENAAATFKVIA